MKNVSGIILLAGNSLRYQKGINKNFDLLNNEYVFTYSLKVFSKCKLINDIILVIREIDKNFVLDVLNKLSLEKRINIVIGGKTRQESVYNALISTDSNIVVIHDGARPMIKDEYIIEGIKAMKDYLGAITAIPVKDTIKIANNNKEIISSTKRNVTYLGQTPQVFKRDILLKLHQKYQNYIDITDDAMLLEKENIKIKIIDGSYKNIKITTKEDLLIASCFIKDK